MQIGKLRVRQKQWSIAAGDGRFEPHPLIPWGVPASDDPHAPPMVPSPLRGEEEEFEDPCRADLDWSVQQVLSTSRGVGAKKGREM